MERSVARALAPPVVWLAVCLGGVLAIVGASTSVSPDRPVASHTSAQCAAVGPTPLSAPMTAVERSALPLAGQGKLFVSVASARQIIVIDLATGRRTIIPAGIANAHEVAVSPDGRWGVAADFGAYTGNFNFDGRQLAVYDLSTNTLARIIDLGTNRGPHDVEFISPTRAVVTTQTTENLTEVDVATGQVLGATETRARGSHTLALTADGRTAFTSNQGEGTFSRMDLSARRFVAKHKVSTGETEGIAASPDGREVWMGLGSERRIIALDGNTGQVLASLPGFSAPERMRMSPDGRKLVVTDFRCETVVVVDPATRRILGPIAGLEGAGVAKILPDNRTAVVLLLDERVVAMVDLETRRLVSRYALNSARPDAAAWGP